MANIIDAYINALLADSAYVDNLNLAITPGDLANALSGRMTPDLAAYIGDNFTVVSQVGGLASSFEATVWRGNAGTPYAGQVYVSTRGTQEGPDFVADADLASSGLAHQQLADMVNWWLRGTTPTLTDADTPRYATQIAVASNGSFVLAAPALGTGELVGIDSIKSVNGHSLGGYLATAFSRLFGSQWQIESVNTFNSAGFSRVAAANIQAGFNQISQLIGSGIGLNSFSRPQNNYFAQNGTNFTTNTWDPVGFQQYGIRIGVFQEDGVQPTALGLSNHFMYKQTDLLALGNVLATLDTSLDLTKLAALTKAGSNQMVASYEGLLDGVRRLLLGAAVTPTLTGDSNGSNSGPQPASRLVYQANLVALQKNDAFKAITGKVSVGLSGVDLASTARNDFASLLSLVTLSPATLKATAGSEASVEAALASVWSPEYTAWQADKHLSQADRAAGLVTFTDRWMTDRAALLGWVVTQNTKDADDSIIITGQGASVPTAYVDTTSGRQILIGAVNSNQRALIAFGDAADNSIAGYGKDDHLYGGAGTDRLDGQGGNDYLEGGTGNDTLVGGDGNDNLLGGTGTDTYRFTDAFGKDTLTDSDGLGHLFLDGSLLSGGKASGTRNVWVGKDIAGNYEGYALIDDARSSTGKDLVIARAGNADNYVTINNFDLAAAQGSTGYLGIKLDSTVKPILREGGGLNAWSDLSFDPASLSGLQSSIVEGGGKTFSISLNLAAHSGDTLSLSLGSLAGKAMKAILGDSTVDANGAVINLAEGQTQVTFALVQDGSLDADATGALSVTYQGTGQSATSNSWGVNLKDSGTKLPTLNGDFKVATHVASTPISRTGDGGTVTVVQPGQDAYTRDGQNNLLTDGNGTLVTNNVIFGAAGNDAINGLTGSDALSGYAGNDTIDGGDGNDLIGGGVGSDSIQGGAGSDIIYASADVSPWVQQYGPADNVWRQWAVPAGTTPNYFGDTWGNYPTASGGVLSGIEDMHTSDTSGDVIDAGAGNDGVVASWGADRVKGGDGDDVVLGLAGDDILEGGAGNDDLVGDGTIKPGFLPSVDAAHHGNDFIDGGDGNDGLTGGGGNDKLFGGAGNDLIAGDWGGPTDSEDFIPLAFQGQDYIDGEDGDDYAEGGGGDDTLYGGAGNDTLWGDTQAKNITRPGDNALWGNDYLDGEDGNDSLIGGGKNDTLFGGAGNDSLWGDEHDAVLDAASNGNDYLDGEDGDDYLEGGGRNDTLFGGAGNDTLWGDAASAIVADAIQGDDYLDGGDGNDYLAGNGGNDTLIGGAGDDTLDGGTGADYLEGGAGSDHYVIDSENDVIVEAADTPPATARSLVTRAASVEVRDTVEASFSYTLGSNLEDLVLGGSDAINGTGNEKANRLRGNTGANVLAGGLGDDYLDGGAGNDVYVFNAGDGHDTLHNTDFLRDTADASKQQAVDTLRFAAGISASDLLGYRFGDDIELRIRGTQDSVTVTGYFAAQTQTGTLIQDGKIDRVEFADGTVWNQATLEAVVARQANNHAPVVSASLATQQGRAGDAFSFALPAGTIIDADAWDHITYSVNGLSNTALPAWLAFDPQTLTLSGTPDTASVGSLRLTVWGTDSYGLAAGTYLTLNVRAANRAPTLVSAVPDQLADQGQDFSYTLPDGAFTDPDADTVTYSATLADGNALPAWLSFNASTLTFSGKPATSGGFSVRVTASDPQGLAASDVFDITVLPPPPPLVGTAGDDTLHGGTGADLIQGLGGGDSLYGGAGDDVLQGGSGFDSLYGEGGNDTLSGGELMNGGAGQNTYIVFDEAADATYIQPDWNASDVVVIAGGLRPGDITVSRSYDTADLALTDVTTGHFVLLRDEEAYAGGPARITQIRFQAAPTTVWTAADLHRMANIGDGQKNYMMGYAYSANAMDGGAGDDQLHGGTFNDTLDGGAGNDWLDGGGGDDTYLFGAGSDRITDVEGVNVLQLSAGISQADVRLLRTGQMVTGDLSDNDSLVLLVNKTGARLYIDQFFQPGGVSTFSQIRFANGSFWNYAAIAAKAGVSVTGTADTFRGTAAKNSYVVDNPLDSVIEAENAGFDTIRSSITYTLPDNVEELDLVGDLALDATGNAGNNVLRGNAAANTLTGGGSAVGGDTYYGGLGDDTYVDSTYVYTWLEDLFAPVKPKIVEKAGEGYDTLVTDGFAVTLPDNVERMLVPAPVYVPSYQYRDGHTFAYRYTGNSLNNVIDLTGAQFTLIPGLEVRLDGGAGADTMIGGDGDNTYVVDNARDVIVEAADGGTDTVISSISYTLGSPLENLNLGGSNAINGTGNARANVINGNAAANVLNGGAGADTMKGGAGADTLAGGTGDDTYVLARGFGADTVQENDATAGNHDVALFDAGITTSQLWFKHVGANLEVSIIGTSDKLVMSNWYSGSQYQVEEFKTSNGAMLLTSQVQSLVQAMASFAPPPMGQTTLSPIYTASLAPVIAANWH